MTDNQWMMNRAGLLNFWYYDDEIFQFSDGKLLLRGTNGSGKSVTMQSILPVLLDGKKTPDRLDPFGSKARRMEDYLLGEKDVVDRDERTGYLFLEYKKRDADQYLTTGIGMQAKRHKGIKSWYFLITDNRRIAIDFELAQTHAGDRVPLSMKELENRIGQGGIVVKTQREYMELVNKYVFGFQSLEAYEDLIKLLIQLRSPKLSKDFKPTVIYEILESALPPLTDDELRHLSDTIENMDQARQQLEQLERENESIGRLVKQYHAYNQFVLVERAKQWQAAQKRLREAERNVKSHAEEKQMLKQTIETLSEEKVRFDEQKAVAEAEKERLREHEVWRLEKEKDEKKDVIQTLNKEIATLENRWDGKKKQHHQFWLDREKTEADLIQNERQIDDLLEDLQLDADEAAFPQHEANSHDFNRQRETEFDFTVWHQETTGHEKLLHELKTLIDDEERLMAEYERLQRQSSEKKREIDALRKDQDHLQQWFTEQRQQLEHEVFAWMDAHPELTFTAEVKQTVARALQGLYAANRYDDVRGPLLSAIHDYTAELKAEKSLTEKRRAEKIQEIEAAKAELDYWKTLKMPNPERANDTEAFRESLNQDGQAYVPFYAAVEFQDHVTDEQRERLEATLKQTGLLDSLITDQPLKPTHDRVIQPKPMVLTATLADYLRPDLDSDSPISAAVVDEVLRSVPLDQDGSGLHIDADGTYSIGCLIGHAPNEGPSKYIGRSSRKRFQLEKIQEWLNTLEALKQELAAIDRDLVDLQEALGRADEWQTTLPDDRDLSELNVQIEKNTHHLIQLQETLLALDQEWKSVHQRIQSIKTELHQKGVHLNLTLNRAAIDGALEAIKSYANHLHRLENTCQRCGFARRRLEDLDARLQEKEEEMDELKGEQNIKKSQMSQIRAELESIEQQLKLKGIDEVRLRIQEVQRLLKEADDRIAQIQSDLPKKEAALEVCEKDLLDITARMNFWSNMADLWGQMVKSEAARGFIDIEVVEPNGILSEFGPVVEKYDRSKLNEQLTKVFINEQQHLTEYRMFEYTEEADRPEWMQAEINDDFEPFVHEWESLSGRRVIQMEYLGQRVSPYFVATSLEKELIDQQGWLDEQDRKLYEDIIVNSVGVILRNRIQRAEKWVREMDKIMQARDNSSGLTFSITWKPLTAESEQELDTKDLVKLLQRNSKFLSEEDLNRITKHFQSRIARAKELIDAGSVGTTLHQVLKEVLDYRKWFEFVLSYKRVNEPKRELTNTAFFKFSGGEKAMAMYIPLFTAAYSRYQEAGAIAPYIISLDEAFAGVDENNIRDMFEVVEQLGFDYIMNSQALWGDYDTISSLSICELVRPKNADFVTVIRYQWDGQKRSLVVDESELVTSES
ncbi:TIGR02680 family protein [Camelliibacillus cellulosilyticus]|uniref:TIGR02680 family protein n=1 Tax=Camelliibacillus cellulosilyticus TaxID=2174486 RepID=A0ABV9GQ88_9BACL